MSNPPAIEIMELGRDRCPIVIVDGFARQPDRWRDEAQGGDYAFRGDFYPGQRKHIDPDYFADIGTRLGSILQSVFGCTRSLHVERALYSIVSLDPSALSLAQRFPHIDDLASNAYAMVHYLSELPFGGTAFYRHKRTGFSRISQMLHQEYLEALQEDLTADAGNSSGYIQGSTQAFEQIGRVDFAYNRAVIYPGNLLHCSIVPPTIEHPNDPMRGRLTIAGFFNAD